MEFSVRDHYNTQFDDAKYQAFLNDINTAHNHVPSFRIAETPVFIDKDLKAKLFEACEDIYDTIADNAANAGIVTGGRPMRPDDADMRWLGAISGRQCSSISSGVRFAASSR